MNRDLKAPAFLAFRLTLGVALLFASVIRVAHYAGAHQGNGRLHGLALGIIEGLGAVLFLIPRTLRIGAIILLLTVGGAFVINAVRSNLRFDLAVYAVGTWLVMVNAPASPARK